jgi:uncharacterized protein
LNRVVVDPSVLLAGIAGHPHGLSATLLRAVHKKTVEAVACPALIAEVRKNLHTSSYFSSRVSETAARRVIAQIEKNTVMLGNPVNPEPILRDPNDDYLVALARTAGAGLIVSADKDLLEHPGLQPPAITTLAFCEMLWLVQPA